jgi:hypothetical protein
VTDMIRVNNIPDPVPAVDTVGKNIPANGGFCTHR